MPVPATRLIRDLEASTGAALFLLTWDIFITLDDEVEFIWSKPWNSWLKWVYLFGRYFAFLLQVTNCTIQLLLTYSSGHLNSHAFRIWFALEGLCAFAMMTGAEIVMMARVYALYNRNKFVGYGFIGLVMIEIVTAFVGFGVTFPDSSFDPETILLKTPGSFLYFGISTVISQTIVLILSVLRYKYMHRRGWAGARIISLMLRDGTLAFLILFLLSLLMVVYHLLDEPFAPSEYIFSISIISVTECRLILNLQKLPVSQPDFSDDTPEFTTIITNDRSRFGTSHNAIMMTVFRDDTEIREEARHDTP